MNQDTEKFILRIDHTTRCTDSRTGGTTKSYHFDIEPIVSSADHPLHDPLIIDLFKKIDPVTQPLFIHDFEGYTKPTSYYSEKLCSISHRTISYYIKDQSTGHHEFPNDIVKEFRFLLDFVKELTSDKYRHLQCEASGIIQVCIYWTSEYDP